MAAGSIKLATGSALILGHTIFLSIQQKPVTTNNMAPTTTNFIYLTSLSFVGMLAATFTELAIQNGLIRKTTTSTGNAKEIAAFYNTIVEHLGKSSSKE